MKNYFGKKESVIPQLTQPVVLEEARLEGDGTGGFRTQWEPYHTAWARVEPLIPSLADEVWRMGEHTLSARYRVWLRAETFVKPVTRLRWHGQILKIVSSPVYAEDRKVLVFLTKIEEEK